MSKKEFIKTLENANEKEWDFVIKAFQADLTILDESFDEDSKDWQFKIVERLLRALESEKK